MELFVNNETEEIIRNINFILSSYKGTNAFYREFGISGMFVDKPSPYHEMDVRTDIIDTLEIYEPRVEVEEVEFIYDREKVTVKLIVIIKGERVNVEFNQ